MSRVLWGAIMVGCSGKEQPADTPVLPAFFAREPTAVLAAQTPEEAPQQLCLDGDTLVAVTEGGRLLVDDPANSGASIEYVGSWAEVYEQDADGAWVRRGRLVPEGKAGTVNWGASCTLEGDFLVVGHESAAQVYIFERSNAGEWQQKSVLRGVEDSGFGAAVELDGTTLAVGAPQVDQVHLYEYENAGQWQHAHTVQGSERSFGSFGAAVALSEDTIAIGAPKELSAERTVLGAVYLYTRAKPGGDWALEARVESEPGDSVEFTHFGSVLALESGVLAVGAPETAASLMFEGLEIDVQGGAVHVFERGEGGSWALEAHLKTLTEAQYSDDEDVFWGFPVRLGAQVALSSGVLVILAPEEITFYGEGLGAAVGALYVYTRQSRGWEQQVRLVPETDTGSVASYGRSLAVDGNRLAIGHSHSGSQPEGSGVSVY